MLRLIDLAGYAEKREMKGTVDDEADRGVHARVDGIPNEIPDYIAVSAVSGTKDRTHPEEMARIWPTKGS